MSKILITGSGKGLGLALHNALKEQGHLIYDYDINDNADVRNPDFLDSIQELDKLIG